MLLSVSECMHAWICMESILKRESPDSNKIDLRSESLELNDQSAVNYLLLCYLYLTIGSC